MADSARPPVESARGRAFHKPDGTKSLPVYVYDTFLATPDLLILRSAIQGMKPKLVDYGQVVDIPNNLESGVGD
jgi:hypothetical protein